MIFYFPITVQTDRMPVYDLLYKGSYLNIDADSSNNGNQKQIDIYIYDKDSGLHDSPGHIIPLELTDNPVRLISVSNDENKFNVINSLRAEIRIFSSDVIDIETFAEGGDFRYYVEIYYDSLPKFYGHLSISDLKQEFQPNPNEILLIASDGLGFLQNIPLTDFDGANPLYENRIIDYLCWALSKTQLQLEMLVAFNLREKFATVLNSDDSGDTHFFKWLWLDAGTFEDDINTCINCYDVLSKIFGETANICQRDGKWHIRIVDELESSRNDYIFYFDYQGNFIIKNQLNFDKDIGIGYLLGWMNDDCEKSIDSAYKSVEENYEFNTQKELLQNFDLSRGTALTDTTIDPEGWVFENGYSPLSSPAPSAAPHYIQRVIVDGQEKERYLVVGVSASPNFLVWRNMRKVNMHAGDKFTFSVDWRLDSNPGGSGHYNFATAIFKLYGDDGSIWTLHAVSGYNSSDPFSYWVPHPNEALFHEGQLDQDDLSQWQTSSVTSPPLPVTGRVEFYLEHNFSTNVRAKHFASISLDYIPFLAGTYAKYKGQRYSISQELNTILKRQQQAYIATSVKKLFQGALLKVGTGRDLYTGTVGFSGNQITFPFSSGYQNYLFTIGKKITTTGTNTGYYTISDIQYLTISDQTILTVKETLTTVSESCTIKELTFDLAQLFYAANIFPDGVLDDTYYHPYGWIQILSIWNQFNRTMRKLEGSIDKLDANADLPGMFNRYFLRDGNISTNNKMFMPLHIDQDLYLAETSIFLQEVFDSTIPKQYPDPDFKYYT